MNVVKQIRVDMNHGELFKVVLRWPCFDVFRSPFSVLSFVSVPVFQFCVLKFYRFEIAHLRRFRACFLEAVRAYCTKPGTQKMCLMALTLYF